MAQWEQLDQATWKAMPLGRKILWVWKNRFWHILTAALMLFLISSWIWQDYIVEQPVLRIEMIDGSPETDDQRAFRPFLDQNGYEGRFVHVSKMIQLGGAENEVRADPYKMLFCSVRSGRNDVYFWHGKDVEQFLSKDALMDLRELLPEDVMSDYADRLIYTDLALNGGFPCGLRLDRNSWVTDNGYYNECMVGIAVDAPDEKAAGQFLQYLLEMCEP